MPLRRHHAHARSPLRLRPRDGEPRCLLEQLSQHIVKNPVPWYCAVAVTAILALLILPYFFPGMRLR